MKQNMLANVTSNRKERQVQRRVIYQRLFNLLEMKDLEFIEGMHIARHLSCSWVIAVLIKEVMHMECSGPSKLLCMFWP